MGNNHERGVLRARPVVPLGMAEAAFARFLGVG